MRAIGLAFCSAGALRLVCSQTLDLYEFPGVNYQEWLNGDHKDRLPVAVISDAARFSEAEKADVDHAIVLANYHWLQKRSIVCLDATAEESAPEFVKVLRITPEDIFYAIRGAQPRKAQDTDKWRTKGSTEGLCAGCTYQPDCRTHATSSRDCPEGREYTQDRTESAYQRYSLSHLIHIALAACDENLLHMDAREFWLHTFEFAIGRLSRSTWVSEYGRALKTAGAKKPQLQRIVRWVAQYGSLLRSGKVGNPPSRRDVKMAHSLPKSGA